MSMTTEHGRMVTYHEGFSPIKSCNLLTMWPWEITWQTEAIISPIMQFQYPNLVGYWLDSDCERLQFLKPHDPLITWPTWGHMAFWKIYISTFTILISTKLGRMLTSEREGSASVCKWLSCPQLLVLFIKLYKGLSSCK